MSECVHISLATKYRVHVCVQHLPEDQKVLWIGDMGAATLHRKSRINLLDFSQKRLKLDGLIAPKIDPIAQLICKLCSKHNGA